MKIPSQSTNYIHRSVKRSALLSVLLLLVCFALSPQTRAVCQQGCDLNNGNTSMGDGVLNVNITGTANTATESAGLFSNTTGSFNTANGYQALFSNTIGSFNTANRYSALLFNTGGIYNTASGHNALVNNTIGHNNTATGANALAANTTGFNNTASGINALANNRNGNNNIALGNAAGVNLTTGSNNIEIGNVGLAGESRTILIGKVQDQTATFIAGISGATVPTGVAVVVDSSGHLGTATSSARFKEAIKPMDKASEAILALKPVTFRYKPDLDPDGVPQFGLVAEEVEKVNPDLVARDGQGKAYTVRYEAVNAMLLNEFLKEHAKVEQLKKNFELKIAEQQKQIEALTAGLQKVSAQLEVSMSAPQTVLNSH
jgi:Chaperone of endosialidase